MMSKFKTIVSSLQILVWWLCFRPFGSLIFDITINQLLAITTDIHNSFETLEETRAVFLDMSKAFDKV